MRYSTGGVGMKLARYVAISMVSACSLFTALPSSRAAAQAPTAVVVPARYRMVELAFDLARFRGAELFSYFENTAPGKDPSLFRWTGSAWAPVSLEDFGRRVSGRPAAQKVIFIGADTPPVVLNAAADSPGLIMFKTYDLASLVNSLHVVYSFTAGEWQYFADHYNFVLRDLNAGRRQYGRYGPPGSRAVPPPAEDPGEGQDRPAQITPRLPAVNPLDR